MQDKTLAMHQKKGFCQTLLGRGHPVLHLGQATVWMGFIFELYGAQTGGRIIVMFIAIQIYTVKELTATINPSEDCQASP